MNRFIYDPDPCNEPADDLTEDELQDLEDRADSDAEDQAMEAYYEQKYG